LRVSKDEVRIPVHYENEGDQEERKKDKPSRIMTNSSKYCWID
jgi:hypothetical protein